MALKVKMQSNTVEDDINARLQELGLSICFDPEDEDESKDKNKSEETKETKNEKEEK